MTKKKHGLKAENVMVFQISKPSHHKILIIKVMLVGCDWWILNHLVCLACRKYGCRNMDVER